MNQNTARIDEKRELTLWESTLPEFQEEPINKRFRSELDLTSLSRN